MLLCAAFQTALACRNVIFHPLFQLLQLILGKKNSKDCLLLKTKEEKDDVSLAPGSDFVYVGSEPI